MARGNGKVTGTVKRLLALEAAQRETNARLDGVVERLEGIDAHLAVMTEHLARQGETLTAITGHLTQQGRTLVAIQQLLAEALPLRLGDPAELIRLFWSEGRLALALLTPGSRG